MVTTPCRLLVIPLPDLQTTAESPAQSVLSHAVYPRSTPSDDAKVPKCLPDTVGVSCPAEGRFRGEEAVKLP